jgi:hypothetical protein
MSIPHFKEIWTMHLRINEEDYYDLSRLFDFFIKERNTYVPHLRKVFEK